MIKKKFRIPLYDHFKVTVIIGDNIGETVDKITKSKSDIYYDGVFLHDKVGCNIIIGFEKGKYTPGIIAHECLHATIYILDFVGLSPTEESEEAYTYLLQYLVDKIHDIIKNNP